MKVVRRHRLRGREVEDLLMNSKSFGKDLSIVFGSKPVVDLLKLSDGELYLFDGKPSLAFFKGEFFPILTSDVLLKFLPKVVVDMGAVPHVCNGADVMSPGVVRVEGEFGVKSFVVVVDERHSKPIAVGRSLVGSGEILRLSHGKVVKNLHFVGDSLWEVVKNIQ